MNPQTAGLCCRSHPTQKHNGIFTIVRLAEEDIMTMERNIDRVGYWCDRGTVEWVAVAFVIGFRSDLPRLRDGQDE